MKKEKQVRSYKRKTKSGKTVIVKAHTAKYEAADEKAKEVSKKLGAGKELEERKKRPTQLEIPFDKEEEKKVLDEVKDEEKKSTSKKVRPVGSGTNGPSPKKKSETKSATDGISKSSGAEIAKAIGEKRAHLLFEKALDKGRASVRKDGMKYTISIEERKDGTYAVFTKGGSSMTGTTKATKSASAKTTAKPATSEPAFTAAEFKQWYHWDMDKDPKNKTAQKVAKVLRAQMGRAGYNKYFNEMTDNYSARGHISAYKKVSAGGDSDVKKEKSEKLTKMTPERKKALKESMAREASNRRTEKAMRDEYAGKISSQQRADIERKEAKKSSLVKSTSQEPPKALVKKDKPTLTWHRRDDGGYSFKVNGESVDMPAETLSELKRRMKSLGYSFRDATRGDNLEVSRKRIKRPIGSGTNGPEPKIKKEAKKGDRPNRKWVISYNEKSPMGSSGSADRKVIVEAKTMKGAEGIYKKKYHQGYDSPYATTLYNIKPYEE